MTKDEDIDCTLGRSLLHGAFPAGEFIGTTAVDVAIPPVTIECVPTWPLTNASLRHSEPTATSPL
ncbi:MAG TPA: hypothetical protein PK486_08540, partial [Trichococcus flocculiformis]|nr:hypothetical protein [Trichococcus flocculiformis]